MAQFDTPLSYTCAVWPRCISQGGPHKGTNKELVIHRSGTSREKAIHRSVYRTVVHIISTRIEARWRRGGLVVERRTPE